jgi:tRNA A37 threonylcarbamoyladenosine synthetase subunit TsaC/SUA5/YrdC
MKQLGGRLPLVLDSGDTGAALPSTIIELRGADWRVLREGAIPVSEIAKSLQ